MSIRVRTILAAAVAAVLLSGPARAGTDDLAKGEWEGKRTFRPSLPTGGGGGGDPSTTDGEEPADGGTTTPPDTGEEDDRAVATEPDDAPDGDAPDGTPEGDDADSGMPEGTPEGTPGDTPDGTPDGDDGGDEAPPEADPEEPDDPDGDPLRADPDVNRCNASWQFTEKQPTPRLVTAQTTLTLTLFRTDAFAFLCNGYTRAISTWYVDWVATSEAHHEDGAEFRVTLSLVNPCPNCSGRITMTGLSTLEAKAQLQTSWGGLSEDSSAFAMAHATWAGPLDCGDHCDATVRDQSSSSTWGADLGGLQMSNVAGKSYAFAVGMAGKGRQVSVPGNSVSQTIQNRGAAAVYAGGSEDNAQAKARSGYELRMEGSSTCGAVCEYFLEQISR